MQIINMKERKIRVMVREKKEKGVMSTKAQNERNTAFCRSVQDVRAINGVKVSSRSHGLVSFF